MEDYKIIRKVEYQNNFEPSSKSIKFNTNLSVIHGDPATGKTTILDIIASLNRRRILSRDIIYSRNALLDRNKKIFIQIYSSFFPYNRNNPSIELKLTKYGNIISDTQSNGFSNAEILNFLKNNLKIEFINAQNIDVKTNLNSASYGEQTLHYFNKKLDEFKNNKKTLILIDDLLDLSFRFSDYYPEIINKLFELSKKNQIILTSGNSAETLEKLFGKKSIISVKNLDFYLLESIISNKDYYLNFKKNISQIREILDSFHSNNPEQKNVIHNMIYLNVITIMETYLSDAFINNALDNKDYWRKLIETTPQFEKEKRSIKELYKIFNNIEDFISDYLLKIIYHDIAKVRHMYKDVLDVEFPQELSYIYRAVERRHDIVHRNGKTKKGVIFITERSEIEELIKRIEIFIDSINNQIPKNGKPKYYISDFLSKN